jgi:hypothetical protein
MKTAKNIEICCPECEHVYRIPAEYCGKDAICANEACGIMFSIPTMEEIMAAEVLCENEASHEEYSTDTVKIERLRDGTGMIPQPTIKTGFDTSDFVMMSEAPPTKKRKIFRM